MKMKLLPKKIISEMTKTEVSTYKKLKNDNVKTGDDMLKAQAKSVIYSRKLDKVKNPTATQKKMDQKLINAGFKAEYVAFKKADEHRAYMNKMRQKYAATHRKGN